MAFEVLDPTHERTVAPGRLAARLASLDGATIGFISNGKQGVREFLDALEADLVERYGVARVVRTTKANVSAPAEAAIVERIRDWHAAVTAVGD